MVKKISIVYLMIMLQGFILAHSFVPHHHHDSEPTTTHEIHADEYGHSHEHDASNHDREHSSSTNIFDILFSNLHHIGDNVVYVQRSEVAVQKVLKKINKQDISNVQQSVSISYLFRKPIIYESRTINHYSNKYNLNFSLRGPPFFIV